MNLEPAWKAANVHKNWVFSSEHCMYIKSTPCPITRLTQCLDGPLNKKLCNYTNNLGDKFSAFINTCTQKVVILLYTWRYNLKTPSHNIEKNSKNGILSWYCAIILTADWPLLIYIFFGLLHWTKGIQLKSPLSNGQFMYVALDKTE